MSNTKVTVKQVRSMAERGRRALLELAKNAQTDEERRAYEARADDLKADAELVEALINENPGYRTRGPRS